MNIEIVEDLIDTLQKPPPQVTPEYVNIVTRTAAFLGRSRPDDSRLLLRKTGAVPAWDEGMFPEQGIFGVSNKNVLRPLITGPTIDSNEKMRNESNRSRNDVYDVINEVNAFVARAKNAGFVPPENPFVVAMQFNVGRVGFSRPGIPGDVANQIVQNIKTYLTLLDAEKTGKLNLNSNAQKAAQLSSARFSLAGFGGSGDAAFDLAKLLPDADEVKAQKAAEALSVFDFTKRVPKVIFTAFYAPDGTPKGVLVGWKKVADASGYVLKRRNIFDGREVQYVVTNEEAISQTARFSEYVKTWILSFYDNVHHDFVFTYMDADCPPHGYFHYRVQAYQLQNEAPGTMFAGETSPVFLSAPMKNQIRQQLEALDPGSGADTISPYPVLAHVLLGDSKYDWLLAAINIRQSINRGDTRTTTRGYSYLAAQLNFLFTQADAGKLVVPKGKNMGGVIQSVNDSIAAFGVNQVLKEILQETGALFHFEGKDANDNLLFRNVDAGHASDSGLISTVVAAIDPETATMNLKTLSSNLPKLLSGEFVASSERLAGGTFQYHRRAAKGGEVEVPPEFDTTTATRAEDEIQYLQKLGNLADGTVDLTTVDGIGTFMRVVRIFSDIGPGRGAPIVSQPEHVVADPVKPPPPPPPPPNSSTQPVQQPFIEAGETQTDRERREAAERQRQQQARRQQQLEDQRRAREEAARERADVKNNPRGTGGGGRRGGGNID